MEESPLFIDERSSLYEIPVSRWTPFLRPPPSPFSPAGALSAAHRMPDPRLRFLPIFLSPQLRGRRVQKGSWAQGPRSRSRHLGPSLLSWAMSALPSGRVRGKQPVHRQLLEVAGAGSKNTVGASKLCTEASPPAAPQEVSTCELQVAACQ